MNFKPFFAKYNDVLNMHMHRFATAFMTIGHTNSESPRWFNYREVSEDNLLTIGSTQIGNLFFEMQISEREAQDIQRNYTEFWNAFKEYRTIFLSANYPTINTQF